MSQIDDFLSGKPAAQEQGASQIDAFLGDAPAGGTASDLAKSLKVGTQRLPGMVTGLADLPFALAAGARPFTKAADALGEVTGFQPGKWADETKFSAGYDQGKKAVDDAWKDGGAGDIALAYLKNPGYTANQVAESLPSMVAGGLAGRALMGLGRVAPVAAKAGGVGPAAPGLVERALGQWAAPVAGGVGEGAVTAGQQMQQYKGDDQQKNALASLGAGVVTGGLGVGAGRVANKLGLETAETAIAKAGTGAAKAADDVPLSAKRRILGGMVSEAVLQELPQSAQEQMWQNWADGKPLMEGVARAATEGALAGGVMGAGANVSDGGAGKRRALAEQQAKQLSEAEAEALRADPSRAWTTEAGAVDPNQPAGERAAPPDAPDLTTSPGAGVARDGMDFTRDVDTSGLSLQDPAELERQRAATVDYQTGDTTPQWDTQPGAAPVRSGLDMPAPDFDTGALGFDPRPLSERMGLVPAANTPLTKAAALSVDTGASPVQFLGATGRDMQLRQTGPGVADESNVIDVQGRVIEDRAIGTPRRLTAQDGARESGAIAFQDGVPRSEIAAIPNIVARAEQLRGYDEAAQKAAQPLALPAPSNLREGLERIRAQREQAARTAQVPPTTGATSVPQASQTQQGSPQSTQAGGPQAGAATATASTSPAGGNRVQAAGLTNGAPTQNPGAQAAPAAGTQAQAPQAAVARPDGWRKSMLKAGPVAKAMGIDPKGKRLAQVVAEIDARDTRAPAPPAPQPTSQTAGVPADGATSTAPTIVEVQDNYGRTHRVRQSDLYGNADRIPTVRKNGDVVAGEEIPRSIVKGGQRAAAQQAQAATENATKGLDGDALERKTDEVMEKVVVPGMLNFTRDKVRALIQEKGVEAADKTIAAYQASNARQAEIIRKYSEAKEKADSARKAKAATEQQSAPQPAPGPVRLGRNNTPLSEGGKPFKTRKAAGDAKKLQPMMRVVSVEGGYALAEKTPAQLAAEERASRRLRNPSTSAPGEPVAAHAFIAAAGGLNRAAAADLGVDGNPRIGNRTLFAGQGRGLSIEQATEMLIAEGYLSEGASHNDAYALIKTSLTRPQYNADGIERIAEAEAQTQFEDYLAAHEEAAAEGDTDPFGVADSFTAEELDDVGYTDADPALQAEVNALIVQADAMGIDTYAILDDIARTYADATQDEFNAKARDAIAAAIARGNQDGGSTAAQAAPAAEPAQEPGLTAPTRADIEAQQEARDKAEREEAARQRAKDQAASQDENRKRIAQASVRAAAEFELGQDPLDSLTGQGSMFDDAPEQPASRTPEVRYELPPEKSAQQQGDESWMAAQSPSFKPTARQQLLMDAVEKALDDGAFRSRDLEDRVAQTLGVTSEQRARNSHNVEGGDFGYDVYGARKAVEAQRESAKSREFSDALNLKPGDVLGTLVFNDGKVTTGVKVVSLNESGLIATITGKRGAATLNGEVGVDAIASAIDRAKERGKRSDGYAEFVESKVAPIDAAQQAPTATETVAQPITRADVTAAKQQASADNRKKVEAKEDDTGNVAMFSRATDTKAAIGTPAATIRAAITKAYGKLLGQLESKGLVTLTQTQEQAIEAAAQARADKTGQSLADVRASLMGSVSNSVATDTPAFKRWFSGSKVVDAEGKPLVVYHGTTAEISAFQQNKAAEKDAGWYGRGIYFTADPDTASTYSRYEELQGKELSGAPRVMPVYVSIQNPYVWPANRRAATTPEEAAAIRKELEAQGHDGVIVPNEYADPRYAGHYEVVAFRPEQVKSAIGNNGNFDPNDLDIRRSANGAIQGFFDPQTGQSFLIADNLTAEAAPGVLMHEVGIHMAADGSMKALFNRAAMMLKLQRGNPFMKAVQARMDAAGETSGEEAAAYIAEAYENDRANAPASVQRWLADLLAAVKAWMFKKGIMGADSLTVADIAAVARANAKSMARGDVGGGVKFSRTGGTDQTMTEAFKRWFAGSKAVDAEGKPLVVYHGTGGDFTSFSTEKLGSNTGAASARRGFFFASNPKVSDFYSKMAFEDLTAPVRAEWDQVHKDRPAGGKWVGGYEGDFVLESDPSAGQAYKERVLRARSAFLRLGETEKEYRKLDRRKSEISHEVLSDYGIHIADAINVDASFLDENPYFAELMREYVEVERAWNEIRMEFGYLHGANVIPVYLKILNPLVHDFRGERYRDVTYNELIKQAQDQGHDGVILKNTFDTSDHPKDRPMTDVYVAFRPEQVKSAIGNNGNFDPSNPDIRFSRAGVSNTGGQAATGWDAPTPTGFDDVIYKLQDKNIDLKRVVESITKATGKVADSINAYLKEELFHKRAAKRVADFGDRELKPLMNKMRLAGLSMEDVEEYLHARHAKEANAVIAQRNPGNAGLQDGGSGMTNAAADNYFAKLDPAQRRKLEAVAKSVDAIIDGTRKLYVDYGLEDQAVVDGWANMYQHYIPLMREDKDGGMGTGQGFSVKGKETKGRTGSTRKVVDILANVAMQREKLIVRGEKNIVAQALVGLAQANPNPDFWEVRSQAPTERVFDPKTGVVVDRPDPLFKSRENVAVAKVKDANGKVTEQMVVFNEDNPRAVRMAAAMKNLDAGNLEGLLGVSAKITRYFSAINTQYNPVFGVVNLVRDVQGAMVNLGTTPLAGQQGKIAKDTLSALRGIYGDIRKTRKGGQATSQWSQLWEQMQDDGGTTGYRELFKTSADRANDLKSILNPEGWMDSKWGKFFTADGRLKVPLSMAQKGATEIFGWLSDYNEAMENGVRLAAYKAALDKGMSREQAASLAKNLTVNFNRKGQAGMQAGAVYAFFNAAMQGTARIGQTLFDMDGGDLSTLRLSKTGKAVVYGGVMLGVMQALALSAAGFDDDDPPEFVRERSLIIPTGDKTYVSIPMPLGLHVIPGIGRHATEFALSGFDKPAKRAVSMVGMFADAFNPIGNAGLSMQTIAPTALDPLVALSENKDWTGKPIARVSSNKAMPGHTQWKDTATGFSKVVAEAINWISGGNEYVAGAFSPTPDQIDYLLAQVGGGVAREAAKVQQTISTAMSGETLPTHKIPLVGRFVGNAASQASQGSAFYANLNRLNELETEIKGLRKDGRFDEAAKLARENPQSMMIAMANRAERDVQRLRREKRELIANDASREQVRAKEDQITDVMTRLNEAVERRKAQAAR